MNDFTLISYPGVTGNSLLTLAEPNSRYMLPFAGKFRVIDFTLRNAFFSGARQTIISSPAPAEISMYAGLSAQVKGSHSSHVILADSAVLTIDSVRALLKDSKPGNFILYNGDLPSIIDLAEVFRLFKKKKVKILAFNVKSGKKSSGFKSIIAVEKKHLLSLLDQHFKKPVTGVDVFAAIADKISSKIKGVDISGYVWPLRNVPEYFSSIRGTIFDPEIFRLLYKEKIIKTFIKTESVAIVGKAANIKNSFISDGCFINGNVEDSVIFPGVIIGEGSLVKNSIVLPNVRIGKGCRIIRCAIDERTDMDSNREYLNVGDLMKIGAESNDVVNEKFSSQLFNGVTLVGKNTRINGVSSIGSGCFVDSDVTADDFKNNKYIYNGMSVVKRKPA